MHEFQENLSRMLCNSTDLILLLLDVQYVVLNMGVTHFMPHDKGVSPKTRARPIAL